MIRSMCLVISATIGIALSAQAQQVADSADVLIFSGSFTTGSREFVRIFLQKGQVYRAEVNVGAVSFTLRPRHAGGDTPTIVEIRGGLGAAESVYEIYPFKDDEYEIKVGDFPEGETASLNIYRDIHASRRRQGIANRGSKWQMGLEFGAGHHGNYRVSPTEQSNKIDRAGGDYEACVLISGSGPLWGCVLGVNVHSSNAASRITWFYVEPRFRLAGATSRVSPEVGLLLRAAFGSSQDEALYNPKLLAPGAYLRISLGSGLGKGLAVIVSGSRGFLLGKGTENETFNRFSAAVSFSF